jgi:hypothetical protein
MLFTGAAALQLALSAAMAPPAPTTIPTGAGFMDAAICAGCIAGGIIAISNGSAEAAAVTMVVGGSGAVAIASGIAYCAYHCDAAF